MKIRQVINKINPEGVCIFIAAEGDIIMKEGLDMINKIGEVCARERMVVSTRST
jgi:hypothetical protein